MATQIQATVTGVLEDLKFEAIPSQQLGGPQQFKATDETEGFVASLRKRNQVLEVRSDGTTAIVDDPGSGGAHRSAK